MVREEVKSPDGSEVCDARSRKVDSVILKNCFSTRMINRLVNDVSIAYANFNGMFICKLFVSIRVRTFKIKDQLTIFDVRYINWQIIISKYDVAIVVQRGTEGKRSNVGFVLQQHSLPVNVIRFFYNESMIKTLKPLTE